MINPSEYIKEHIRTVPNWPQEGVMFRDITPLLQNPKVFRVLIDMFVHRYMDQKIDVIAGLDARGFIIGSVLAYELNLGFVPIRKKVNCRFTPCRKNMSWNTAAQPSSCMPMPAKKVSAWC
jgi:adenine phosphoribosyltransferase